MIRITNIKLPLDHKDPELQQEILKALNIKANQLIDFTVFRRGFDARSKNQISLLYTIDVTTKNEAAILENNQKIPRINPTNFGLNISPDSHQ